MKKRYYLFTRIHERIVCFNNLLENMGQLRTSSTIAMGRQLKSCLYKAGIDTSMFTRAAEITMATMSGVTVEDIQYVTKTAHWSSEGVFQKFNCTPQHLVEFGS